MHETFRELLSGSIAGSSGMLIGHPLDTCKVRMQQSPIKFPTLLQSVRSTLKGEGVGGLFRGIIPPFFSVALFQAVCFASFSEALPLVTKNKNVKGEDASTSELFLAGSISGTATVFVTTPTDLLKIRLQLQSGARETGLREFLQCGIGILKRDGFFGFYRGFSATAIRDSWSTGLYFVVYHELKRKLKRADYNGAAVEVTAGGIAGATAWGACLPCDVVKTRMQALEGGSRWLPTLNNLVEREGVGVLYRGATPLLTRAFLVNAITFYVYEECHRSFT